MFAMHIDAVTLMTIVIQKPTYYPFRGGIESSAGGQISIMAEKNNFCVNVNNKICIPVVVKSLLQS